MSHYIDHQHRTHKIMERWNNLGVVGTILFVHRIASWNEYFGCMSTGMSETRLNACFRWSGTTAYFANHAAVRARSPVASCSNNSFARALTASGIFPSTTA